jgi:hypothetical protein
MNNNSVLKISRFISIAIMVLGAVFIILIGVKGDAAMEEPSAQNSILSPFFYLAYIVLGLTALLSIGFPIVYALQNPKQAMIGLVVILVFASLFGISWLIASDAVEGKMIEKAVEEELITPGGIRRVGMGLISTYILIAGAVVVTIYSGVSKIFK